MKNQPPRRASSPKSNDYSRRQFMRTSVAALATVNILPGRVLGAGGQTPPSGKPSLAGVGVGGVGFGQLQGCAEAGFHIVALCDVDDRYAKKAFDQWPQARRYRDYREMLQAEGDKIDAVYCGTPDHTHALVTLAALRRKKHVCCVKPLTRTIHEGRVVLEASRKAGVATQVTAAPNTSDEACRTCELIWAGAIGAVREVHIWTDRPVWPQGMLRPQGADPVPLELDWKLWLGPARERPFKGDWPAGDIALQQVRAAWQKAVYHPFNFRGWWDFGTGALGDMGCHYLNTPFRALRLVHPTSVQATATKVFAETAPLASIVTWDFPSRGEMPPVRLVWYDGGLKPPMPRELENQSWPSDGGALYIGDAGKMLGSTVLGAQRAKKFADVPRTLPRRGNTWAEWFTACRGGEPAGCPFDWAGPLTEAVLLGNVAIRTGERLQWDAARMKFTDHDAANQYLKAEYHNGWSLEL